MRWRRPLSAQRERKNVFPTPNFAPNVEERIAALHRIGEPMEVAGAVVFLASPAAALITGTQFLSMAGGRRDSGLH
jgi:NAD(P)-dependent dehydrogenase (short-subunit alcohol dehydrogenase family)